MEPDDFHRVAMDAAAADFGAPNDDEGEVEKIVDVETEAIERAFEDLRAARARADRIEVRIVYGAIGLAFACFGVWLWLI